MKPDPILCQDRARSNCVENKTVFCLKNSPVSRSNFSEGIVFMTSKLSPVFNELKRQVENNNHLLIHHLTIVFTNLPQQVLLIFRNTLTTL